MRLTVQMTIFLPPEFTCWLLAELITVHGSPLVCEANVKLQASIMRLLDSRNPHLFSVVIKDYVCMGLGEWWEKQTNFLS